mgnify:CR=1 FL=1
MQQVHDTLQLLVPSQPCNLFPRLLLQGIEDGQGILERFGLLPEVLDCVNLEGWRSRSLLEYILGHVSEAQKPMKEGNELRICRFDRSA